MKKLAIALLVLLAYCVSAQRVPDFLRYEENKIAPSDAAANCSHVKQVQSRLQRRASAIVRRPYDVLNYVLLMDWRKPLTDTGALARQYWGVNSIRMRIDSDYVQVINLDANELKIDSVLADGELLTTPIVQSGDQASIRLAKVPKKGDVITLDVYYTQMSAVNPKDFNGFVAASKGQWGSNPLDTVRENIAYTMSEPIGARDWMPCNDEPYDKAQASITIIVPSGYSVCSNGLLLAHRVQLGGDNHESFTWGDTTVIPTYLMVVVASKLAQYDGIPYKRISDTSQHVPVPVFLWPYDSVAYSDNLLWMQSSTVHMIEVEAQAYGEYPFAKYGQALLFPFFGGSMEHQSNTTHHKRCLTDRWENVIAHELMHQWTGDKVTCATWGDIWLNEGGATYGEYLWIESTRGVAAARSDFGARRDKSYFSTDEAFHQPTVYGIPLANLFNNGTTYVKGGWVYHMLRHLVGDSTYFDVMKKYFNHFAYQSIETEDMVSFLEQSIPNPRVPFRTFFDQWIYKQGHPYYSAQLKSVVKVDSSYDISIHFRQQSIVPNAPPLFVMPVTLRFHDNYSKGTFDYTFLNDSLTHDLVVRVPFLPHSMVIDEDENILCIRLEPEMIVRVADDASTAAPQALQVYPNPVDVASQLHVRYTVDSPAMVHIELCDVTGRRIETVHQGLMESGEYEAHSALGTLAVGTYVVRMTIGEKIFFATFTCTH